MYCQVRGKEPVRRCSVHASCSALGRCVPPYYAVTFVCVLKQAVAVARRHVVIAAAAIISGMTTASYWRLENAVANGVTQFQYLQT